MRVLVQRVLSAAVHVGDEAVGAIARGLLLFVGATHDDTLAEAQAMAAKAANLRLFDDATGVMNRSALDLLAAGEDVGLLVVSQFTLYADARKGLRPSYVAAARPEQAAPLVEAVIHHLRGLGLTVATGRFGAEMQVSLVNDGPVTIWLDTADR